MTYWSWNRNEFGELVYGFNDPLTPIPTPKSPKICPYSYESTSIPIYLPPDVYYLTTGANFKPFRFQLRHGFDFIVDYSNLESTIRYENVNSYPLFLVSNRDSIRTSVIEKLKTLARKYERGIVIITAYPIPQLGFEKDFKLTEFYKKEIKK